MSSAADAAASDARTTVVTGGSSGIGAATVALLIERGHRVVSLDRALPDASLAAAIAHGRFTHLACDLAREESVVQAFAQIAADHGAVHGLVNSAGVESRHLLCDMPLDAWDRVIDINLRGTMLCVREAAPLMPAGAAIVNVASIAGKRMSYSGDAAYTASKGAVLAFTRHMAFELAGQGLRMNAVCPGPTLTPMIHRSLGPERIAAVAQTVPLGRWVDARDVAEAIAFLLSPGAAMITGSTIDVDGGMLVSNGTPHRDYIAARQAPHRTPPSMETTP
ncbi:SDR family NAD(P)-dependent oxidoreductase [Hydrogenophaga crocea]|uniref:SDR family oxidoreductase n=1 Tax=Hydrogenophaga crocea TaxID=2716225 RepID=A0A6G8IJP1_9BURK|nr:SDR family oxidoreductase [Hydrogenophaga crocea]QIM53371.1 SDR family oxidoreductase [Hydrogenophaga crocea]